MVETVRSPASDQLTPRALNLDLLRILAAFAVVWLHVSAEVVTLNPSVYDAQWWSGNVADSFSRWCVPVFVMISGALLLAKPLNMSLSTFYQRRLMRIVIPLVFWTVFYLFWRYVKGEHIVAGEIIRNMLRGTGSYYHMWYFYMIAGLILVAPYLRMVVSVSDDPSLRLLWGGCLAVAAVEKIAGERGATFLTMFLPYIGYFIAGHHLRAAPIRLSRQRALLVFFGGGLLVAVFTGALLPKLGSLSWEVMYSYQNPLVILMSLSIFILFAEIGKFPKKLEAMIELMAPLTFGIYVMHPAWLDVLHKAGLDGFYRHPLIGVPVTTVVAFGLSAFCTAGLMFVPGMRRVVA
jgi:surface polysaccharide O-acyltransferase-like enzyme